MSLIQRLIRSSPLEEYRLKNKSISQLVFCELCVPMRPGSHGDMQKENCREAVAAHSAPMLDSVAGFSQSKPLLSPTLLIKQVCYIAIVFLGNASGILQWIELQVLLLAVRSMNSNLNVNACNQNAFRSIFLVLIQLCQCKSQHTGLKSTWIYRSKILENTIVFSEDYISCLERDFLLFPSTLLTNNVTLYFSLTMFDAEKQHTN